MVTNNCDNFTNPISVSQGGFGVVSNTAYSVLTGGTTSTSPIQSIANLGLSGQTLISQGPSKLPIMSYPGNWVLLSSQTALASASINFTSIISNIYSSYVLLFTNCTPVGGGVRLQFQVSTNNGSSYIATGYQTVGVRNTYNSTTLTALSPFGTSGTLVTNNSVYASGRAYFTNVTNGGNFFSFGTATLLSTVPVFQSEMLSNYIATTNVNAFTLFYNAGNIATGTFTLFGIQE